MKKLNRLSAWLLAALMLLNTIFMACGAPVFAETPLASRLTDTDGTLYGAENILYSTQSGGNRVNIEPSGNEILATATSAATSTTSNQNYARLSLKPFGTAEGTTVVEFDTETYRAGSTSVYFYIFYGSSFAKSERITVKAGGPLGTTSAHWSVIMTNTANDDGTVTVAFQVYKDGTAVTLENSTATAAADSKLLLYLDQIYYVAATEDTEADTSWAKVSNFHVYRPASSTFQGEATDAGNVAFNLPVKSYTATIAGAEVAMTKAPETETAINEYSVDTSALAAGTHTVQVEATAMDGQTATLTYTIEKEPALVSRLTDTNGTLYGAENILYSTQSGGNRVNIEPSGNEILSTATSAATSTTSNQNYARLSLKPFGTAEGTTVVEFDTETYRAGSTSVYFYIFYGSSFAKSERITVKAGGPLGTTSAHWSVIMTNTANDDGTVTVAFQVYKDGTAVTLENSTATAAADSKLLLYLDQIYYVAESADASWAKVSNFHVYRPATSTFQGEATDAGNVAFNLPLKSYTVTVDGDETTMTKVDLSETAINEYTVDTSYIGSGNHTITVTATALDGQTTTVSYEIEGVYPAFEAEVMNASGGADAIVSMTFDDGLYDTALLLNEKFAQYGLRASTMLITSRIENDKYAGTLSEWQAIYDAGYLEPESHTLTHLVLPSDYWAERNSTNDDGSIDETKYANYLSHNTEENYQKELVQSKTDIQELFNHTSVGFAPSNNTLSDGAYEVVMQTYYGVRSGSRGLQSLDPQIGNAPGQWHNLYMNSFSYMSSSGNPDTLCGYLDDAINQKGWLVTLCHGIGDSGDVSEETADIWFSYLAEQVKAGKVWCTTFGDAIKYVRERQASTLQKESDGETITLNLTRAMTTEDGLDLPADVFDVPLTVKVILPEGWMAATVTQNGETKTVNAVRKAGVSYAYLDIVPNSGTVTLTTAEMVEEPLGEPSLTLEGQATEKFYAGNYQLHVAVPQRAQTRNYVVLAAQYQDQQLVDITTKDYAVTVNDCDTELVLDVAIQENTDSLTCMVWDNLTTMTPMLTAPKTFSVMTEDENAPYVILKFDDLGYLSRNTMEGFENAVNLCKELGVVASLGVIGERFDGEVDASVFETIRDWHNDGFEIWHHGYDHAQTEYNTCTYEEQKEFFGKTIDLMQEKCGITITAFGSPYNNSTEVTRQMIETEFPQIKAIMLADYEGTEGITVLDSRVNLETKTGVICGYQGFQSRYAKRGDKDYIVLQGHPAEWSEESFLNLKLNIQFLKKMGCTFITPTAYVNK